MPETRRYAARVVAALTLIVLVVAVVGVIWKMNEDPPPEAPPLPRLAEPTTQTPPLLGRPEFSGSTPATTTDTHARVSGLVLDAASKAPIAGALVYWQSASQGALVKVDGTAVSSADGHFEIASSPRGGILEVQANGYLHWSGPASGDPQNLKIELDRGQGIQGMVLGRDGTPVSGVRVVVHPVGNAHAWPLIPSLVATRRPGGGEAMSREDGTFEVTGLEAEREYTLRAQKTGFVHALDAQGGYSVAVGGEPVKVGQSGIRVVMLAEEVIWTRILDASTGKPIEAFSHNLMLPRGWGQAYRDVRMPEQSTPPPGVDVRVYRRDSGSGTAKAILRVSAPGYEQIERMIEIGTDEARAAEVRLTPLPDVRFVDLTFRARFHSDVPFSGKLVIHLSSGTEHSSLVMAFTDGQAVAPVRLPMSRFKVKTEGYIGTGAGRWWSSPTELEELDLSSGRVTEHEFRLDGGRIKLLVLDKDHQSVRGYDLEVLGARIKDAGGMWNGWDRPDLGPDADALPSVWENSGPARVRVHHAELGVGEADVVVPADGTEVPVVITLAPRVR